MAFWPAAGAAPGVSRAVKKGRRRRRGEWRPAGRRIQDGALRYSCRRHCGGGGRQLLFNLISPGTPAVVLPAATGQRHRRPEYAAVTSRQWRVRPETVQKSVIETLGRPSSYARTVTILTAVGEDAYAADTARVWVDVRRTPPGPIGPRRRQTRPPARWNTASLGRPEKEGTLYLWYNSDRGIAATRRTAGRQICRSVFRPTRMCWRWIRRYADTGYERKSGTPCVYVEVEDPELHYPAWRYWVSVSDGVAGGGRDRQDGQVVLGASASTAWKVHRGHRVHPTGRDGAPPHQ